MCRLETLSLAFTSLAEPSKGKLRDPSSLSPVTAGAAWVITCSDSGITSQLRLIPTWNRTQVLIIVPVPKDSMTGSATILFVLNQSSQNVFPRISQDYDSHLTLILLSML